MKEETTKLLEKAQRALRAAEILLKAGDPEFAAGRTYYSMLYAAQALLREKDLQYRKHTGVHSAFGEHFLQKGLLDKKYHRWLLDAFDERLRGDYDCNASFSEQEVSVWIEKARDFLQVTRKYLEDNP